jgi:hypothetical protein
MKAGLSQTIKTRCEYFDKETFTCQGTVAFSSDG